MNTIDFCNVAPRLYGRGVKIGDDLEDYAWNTVNKFTPNLGDTPTFFEGRSEYCDRLEDYIIRLGEGNLSEYIPTILGPVGIGKTALLKWIESYAKDYFSPNENLSITYLSGIYSRSPADIRRVFCRDIEGQLWKNEWRKISEKSSIDVASERRSWERTGRSVSINRAILRKYEKAYNLILVDDADEFNVDTLKSLIQLVDNLKQNGSNVLLVLCGRQRLVQLIKSFSLGKGSEVAVDLLNLRPLTIKEIENVISLTLSLGGYRATSDVIDVVCEESFGLPVLLQMWGFELWWQAAYQRKDEITEIELADARKVVERKMRRIEGFNKWGKKDRYLLNEIRFHLSTRNEASDKELNSLVELAGRKIGLNEGQSAYRLWRFKDADIVCRYSMESGYTEAFPNRIKLALNSR